MELCLLESSSSPKPRLGRYLPISLLARALFFRLSRIQVLSYEMWGQIKIAKCKEDTLQPE